MIRLTKFKIIDRIIPFGVDSVIDPIVDTILGLRNVVRKFMIWIRWWLIVIKKILVLILLICLFRHRLMVMLLFFGPLIKVITLDETGRKSSIICFARVKLWSCCALAELSLLADVISVFLLNFMNFFFGIWYFELPHF